MRCRTSAWRPSSRYPPVSSARNLASGIRSTVKAAAEKGVIQSSRACTISTGSAICAGSMAAPSLESLARRCITVGGMADPPGLCIVTVDGKRNGWAPRQLVARALSKGQRWARHGPDPRGEAAAPSVRHCILTIDDGLRAQFEFARSLAECFRCFTFVSCRCCSRTGR